MELQSWALSPQIEKWFGTKHLHRNVRNGDMLLLGWGARAIQNSFSNVCLIYKVSRFLITTKEVKYNSFCFPVIAIDKSTTRTLKLLPNWSWIDAK